MKRSRFILHAALALALFAASADAATKRAPAGAPAAAETQTVRLTATPHEDSLLVAALARMAGVIPGSDSLVAWALFRAHPQRTVDLILPTLRPVKRDLYLGAPNMVWRVRVLQRLTGMELRGRTRARLTGEEKLHLLPDSAFVVRFAGEDRARGMTWTAPADAQDAIFKRWRAWWAVDERKPVLPLVPHEDDSSWWY